MTSRHELRLRVEGGILSGLLAEPEGPAHGTLVALHGAAMSASYFDAEGHDRSLLTTAVSQGLRVVAFDRPGYGYSREHYPAGLGVVDQAEVLAQALHRHFGDTENGFVIYGHSFGGKVALALAAQHPTLDIQRVELCGVAERYSVPVESMSSNNPEMTHLHWGPIRYYPAGTFLHAARSLAQPIPAAERAEVPRWPEILAQLAPTISCPLHFSFAEHEGWWNCSLEDRERLGARFPKSTVGHSSIPNAGHNASLGFTAKEHHVAVIDRSMESFSPRGRAAGSTTAP